MFRTCNRYIVKWLQINHVHSSNIFHKDFSRKLIFEYEDTPKLKCLLLQYPFNRKISHIKKSRIYNTTNKEMVDYLECIGIKYDRIIDSIFDPLYPSPTIYVYVDCSDRFFEIIEDYAFKRGKTICDI